LAICFRQSHGWFYEPFCLCIHAAIPAEGSGIDRIHEQTLRGVPRTQNQ